MRKLLVQLEWIDEKESHYRPIYILYVNKYDNMGKWLSRVVCMLSQNDEYLHIIVC